MTPLAFDPRSLSSLVKAGVAVVALGLAVPLGVLPKAAAEDQVHIGYLGLEADGLDPVSLLDTVIEDAGLRGAELGIADNNATGAFMGQEFILAHEIVERDGDVLAAFDSLLAGGADWIISDLPYEQLSTLMAGAAEEEVTIFNVRAPDNVLRNEECLANLFHTTPSRAMLTDALAQFLIYKRWDDWALVVGNTPEDALLADAFKRSAERFGAQIVGELQWPHTPMARRSEGGFHAIQREVPVFLQDLHDHDMLLVIDETDYFGEYFPYQTWYPRPVGGSVGLIPAAWHRAHESWGAVQLHRRFEQLADRWMTPRDFAAWVAVRAVGEAASRTQSVEREALVDYMRSESFELGAYLGDPVTFRPWDQQMRQPVLVAGPRMVASVSPQEGFLHPRTPLDSLGDDEPETRCQIE